MGALPYFDTNAKTTLRTDTLKKGLGACLNQNGKVMSFASCALIKAEKGETGTRNNLEYRKILFFPVWKRINYHYNNM